MVFWIALILWISTSNLPSDSIFIGSCAAISVLSCFLLLNPWQSDPFEPIKLVVFLYGGSFGLGPLLLGPEGMYKIPYLGGAWERLLSEGSLLALFGLLVMLFGYYLYGLFPKSKPCPPWELTKGDRKVITIFGIILLVFGFFSYAILVDQAGGLSHFLLYTGGRAEIFQNAFGALYWTSFLLISGLSAIGCAQARSHPFIVVALAVAIGLLYFPFQGREAIIAPIMCGLMLVHYGYKRIGAKWIMIMAFSLTLMASFVGYFRTIDKADVYGRPEEVVESYTDQFSHNLKRTFALNLEQMDAFLIALRHVEISNKLLNGRSFIAWLEPVDRHLLGDIIDSEQAGRFMTILVNPEHRWTQTALSPSIVGELYLNFALAGLSLGLFLYGLFIRFLDTKLRTIQHDPLILMLYPYALWSTAKIVIDGTAHFFRIVVVLLPILLAYFYFSARFESQKKQFLPDPAALVWKRDR
ncbi:MAG: hypothetical protein MRJ67_02440 [Nitrospirales bacterium]|nr:hypothetical protein [Nitrospirales bacterium]